MDIYVIRWAKQVDGEWDCGNFDYSYTDEKSAAEAMLRDFNNIRFAWERDVKERNKDLVSRVDDGDNGIADYCEVSVKGGGTNDFHKWWIDKLAVEQEG